ncbi:DUF2460 domain-containing protein [Flexibacterium corallicola]|uniref:DUF2460 domain-containing protein n=1 Tax=Flexibacterium corallicola TaxID=3037259 RepID=UPI00286F462F|nr:DUF2460 domain-containing protein [Pseudovibrio sp. M1P-2-3]
MSFLEEQFPAHISFGASGGPQRLTRVMNLANGHEVRATNWAGSRRRYDVGTGIRSLDDLRGVLNFFEQVRGRLYGFRFKDPFDYSTSQSGGAISAVDEVVGEGDGTKGTFQLLRRYGAGENAYERPVLKPVGETLKVAVNGQELHVGVDVSLEATTGKLTFLNGAPDAGSVVTAGFEFDTPVRFDSDLLEVSLTHFSAGQVPSIPLVEISA